MAGRAVHPSVKALCVSILTLSLSHIINCRGTKQRGHDEGVIVGCVAGSSDATSTTLPPSTPFQKRVKRSKSNAFEEVTEKSKRHLDLKSMQSPSDSFAAVKSVSSVVTPQAPDHVCDVESSPMDDYTEENAMDQDANLSSSHRSPCEGLGKELIAALLYEDLKDREDRRKVCDRPSMNPGIWYHVRIMTP